MDLDELSTKALLVRILRELEEGEGRDKRIEDELAYVAHVVRKIEREIRPPSTFNPATSVTITQIGNPMLTISPGNAPEFVASLQPVNAGPFVAANVAWTVTGDPGASVAQDPTDTTGLSAILTLTAAVVIGATLALTVVVTNQDGSTVTATDTLTVVPANTPPPAFVPATGVAIQQTV